MKLALSLALRPLWSHERRPWRFVWASPRSANGPGFRRYVCRRRPCECGTLRGCVPF